MLFAIEIAGIRPIVMHSGNGLDPTLAANIEIAEITGKRTKRTASDHARLAELECQLSLWLTEESGTPTIPPGAIRSCIETAARKLKQGPQVREGMIVSSVDDFCYDRERYGVTVEELGKSTQFTAGVVVQRSRIRRTRAKFDTPWGCAFTLDTDDELVDKDRIDAWLDIAGRRIGLGDWRPEKSGDYGRFETVSVNKA